MTRVTFNRVVQDSREFGSTETHSVSRVFFELEQDGNIYQDLFMDITEAVGSTHGDEELSLGVLQRGDGEATGSGTTPPDTVDRDALEAAVRSYYQWLVNSAGFGKHLAKDKGFRTYGDELGLIQTVEL